MASYVVGLTGGIGSGKTTVSDRFAEHGIVVADADVVSRQIVEPGQPAYQAIIDHFGDQVLYADQTLNRRKLREIVFSDATERAFLEGETQGRIMRSLAGIIKQAASPYCLLVLSAGTGKSPLMKRLLVVDVPPELQVARVTVRDETDAGQVKAIMATQPGRELRLSYADDVIVNDGNVADLYDKVDNLHAIYQELAHA